MIKNELKFDIKSASTLFHRASIIASYQNVNESRINRKFDSDTRGIRKENVQVIGINMDMVRELDSAKVFYYGFEVSHNIASSDAKTENIFSGLEGNLNSRYPNGGSNYTSFGAYISYKHKFSHKVLLNTGLRYSHIIASSKFKNDGFIALPYDEIKFNKGAVSGNIGLFIRPKNGLDIKVSVSSGFRAPNIDDYGKVFEKNGFVVVPNDQLKPEYVLNGDVGIVKRFGWKKLVLEGSVFYTHLFDAIVREDAMLNGQDSILYDGEMGKIQTNRNASQAFVTGFNLKFDWMIAKNFHFNGTFNYTKGINLEDDSPLAHIPPMFGNLEFGFEKDRFQANLNWRFNAKKRIEDYNLIEGIDNVEQTPYNALTDSYYGTPKWSTLGINSNYKLNPARVQLIRKRLKESKNRKKIIAKEFNISLEHLKKIEKGEMWGWVEELKKT